MALTREGVLHVARLARLALTDEEVERFREQLNAILEAVATVAELDLAEIEPVAPTRRRQRLGGGRAPSLAPAVEALADAPDRDGSFFRVPAA